MIEKFTVEQSAQREWAWLLALYLFLGSLGGGLFLLGWWLGLPPSFALAAIGLVVLGALVLLVKLGSPQRAWRAISRPTTSWISRGVWFVAGFVLLGGLSVGPATSALAWLPWNDATTLGRALAWSAALLALLTMVYPGFVVSSARAIPFWSTPLLPLLFFGYAWLAAAGAVLIGSASVPGGTAALVPWTAALIVVNAALCAVYLLVMRGTGGSAAQSVQRLSRGSLGAVFWIGVVLVGWLLPLAALLLATGAAVPAGVGIEIGAVLLRWCVLRAGVYHASPALAPPGVDFGTLTRTSTDFAREYAGMVGARGSGRR
ncbi:MAG: polysulfide reductase NrfD [Hyphomicrobiales bacterium]|nr:polysulfide reductase NrfD [Hyphomicrobiales bacterium]